MQERATHPNTEPPHWAETFVHVPFFLHRLQLKIEMLFHPQLHNFIASFGSYVSSTYLNNNQIWSPECAQCDQDGFSM